VMKHDEESENTSNVVPTGEKGNADNEEEKERGDRSFIDTFLFISTPNDVVPINYEYATCEEKAGIDVLARLNQRQKTISLK
jgi:hypothetical protein